VHAIEQALPEPRDPAADDDGVDIDREHEDAHGPGHAVEQALADADGALVTTFGGIEHGRHGVRLASAPLPGDAGAGGHRFEPAALPVEVEGSARVDEDVPDLARGTARASPEFAAEHEAGGETGAEVEVPDRFV
jgi:hypothetical protein